MKKIIGLIILVNFNFLSYGQTPHEGFSESDLIKKWIVSNSPISLDPIYLNTVDTSSSYLKFNSNHTYEAVFKKEKQIGTWRLDTLSKTKLYLLENGSNDELPLPIIELTKSTCSLSINTSTGIQTIKLIAE